MTDKKLTGRSQHPSTSVDDTRVTRFSSGDFLKETSENIEVQMFPVASIRKWNRDSARPAVMTRVLILLAPLSAFGAGWICTRRHTSTPSINRDKLLTPQSLAKTKLIITTFSVSDGGLAALRGLSRFSYSGTDVQDFWAFLFSPARVGRLIFLQIKRWLNADTFGLFRCAAILRGLCFTYRYA